MSKLFLNRSIDFFKIWDSRGRKPSFYDHYKALKYGQQVGNFLSEISC